LCGVAADFGVSVPGTQAAARNDLDVSSGWGRAALSKRIFTGLQPRRPGKLIGDLSGPWMAAEEARLRERRGHDRERAPRAGPDHDLPFTDRVIVTLVYLRFQLPHAVLAVLYGVDRSTITRAVREVRPLLAARGFAVPHRPDLRLRTLADVFAYADAHNVELRIDGTEVQVRRPRAHKPGRRAFVSGKKKMNTKKATVVTDEQGCTLWAGAFRPGRMHDQTAVRTEGIADLFTQFPQVKAKVDAGYRGLAKEFPDQVQAPPLKPKKDASPEETAFLSTGSWAAVVPSSHRPDRSIGARPPRAAPRSALPSIRRCLRRPGRRSRARAAVQAQSTSSTCWAWTGSPRTRENVAASGRRGCPAASRGRAEPVQDPGRGGRGPRRRAFRAVIPGRARGEVVQRKPPAPRVPAVRHRAQEPEETAHLSVVPGQDSAVTGQDRFTGLLALRAGHRPGQRRGQCLPPRRGQVRGNPGRQDQGRPCRGQELRHRRNGRHHHGKNLRDQDTGRHGHDRLGHAGFLCAGSGDFSQKNQSPGGNPASPQRHVPLPRLAGSVTAPRHRTAPAVNGEPRARR
jgi:hypothetical protein